MRREFLVCLLLAVLFVPTVLLLDRAPASRQLALGLATAAALVAVGRVLRIPPRQLVAAVLVATAGEIVLSVIWGLYSYGHARILPLYVPPGHGIFYALAAATAQQEFLRRHGRAITTATFVFGSLLALWQWAVFDDQWGLAWWIGAMLLMAASRRRLLLAACFAYTTALEWLGTSLGNWHWAATVPHLGLHSANPPSGVGILYIVLDLAVAAIAGSEIVRGDEDDLGDGLSTEAA